MEAPIETSVQNCQALEETELKYDEGFFLLIYEIPPELKVLVLDF